MIDCLKKCEIEIVVKISGLSGYGSGLGKNAGSRSGSV